MSAIRKSCNVCGKILYSTYHGLVCVDGHGASSELDFELKEFSDDEIEYQNILFKNINANLFPCGSCDHAYERCNYDCPDLEEFESYEDLNFWMKCNK